MRLATFVLASVLIGGATAPAARVSVPEQAVTGPWSVCVVDDTGRVLPTFRHRGGLYALGAAGERYAVRVRNGSPGRVEVVVSVDGRDVLDGRPADWKKRGYLVEPRGELSIEGFRIGESSVGAFRFGAVSRSYAARMGDARDVGVIGVAVFAEDASRPLAVVPQRSHRSEAARGEPEPASARAPCGSSSRRRPWRAPPTTR